MKLKKTFTLWRDTIFDSFWPNSWSAPSHYQKQCWDIVNSYLRNTFQWNLKHNSHYFIKKNLFDNVVCEMAEILSQPQCVNIINIVQYFGWSAISECISIQNGGRAFSRSCSIAKINPLWPSEYISWWEQSGSTLTPVLACCLVAPNHYLN